jgi:hypothetical protein
MANHKHWITDVIDADAEMIITDILNQHGISKETIELFLTHSNNSLHLVVQTQSELAEPFTTDHKTRKAELSKIMRAAKTLSSVSIGAFQEINTIRPLYQAVDLVDAETAYHPKEFVFLARLAEIQLNDGPHKRTTDPKALQFGYYFHKQWSELGLPAGSGPNSQFNRCLSELFRCGKITGDPENVRSKMVPGEFNLSDSFIGRWLRSLKIRMRRARFKTYSA